MKSNALARFDYKYYHALNGQFLQTSDKISEFLRMKVVSHS